MKGPKTNDVDPEKLIPAAIGGKKKALNSLVTCDWLDKMLTDTCNEAGRQFHLDDHELRTFVERKLRTKIRTIKNTTNKPWCDRLEAWCKVVVRNRCRGLFKHLKVQERYRERVIRENSPFTRCGERIMAPPVKTPEEELMDKEREDLLQSKAMEIPSTAKRVFDSFPPRTKRIAELWSKGKSPKEIIQETGEAQSNVYRILKEIEKAIAEAIGAAEVLSEQPKLARGLQKLVGG